MNLSTSQAINRSKEVGVRKVVGAFRNQLIGQLTTAGIYNFGVEKLPKSILIYDELKKERITKLNF